MSGVKTTMNNEWKQWTIQQLQANVSKDKIRETLISKQNYDKQLVEDLLNNKIYIFSKLHVVVKDNFLTDDECEHFINIGKKTIMNQALVAGDNDGEISKGRTGTNCWVKHNQTEVTQTVADRIAHVINMPLRYAESFQIIHYEQNQEYKPHYDGWNHDNSEKSKRMMGKRGQRLCTCLVYLNTPEEGGDTIFPKQKRALKAEKGRLLFFSNVEQNTNILHPDSLHGGMPVIKGEKWAFNLWFREKYICL
jgi:prolyl 4-hydroxylase